MADKPMVLVTGGAGYIGSHTVLQLLKADYPVVVVDNFSRGYEEALRRVARLANKQFDWHKIDLSDQSGLTQLMQDYPVETVIHFAAFKNVGEADQKPELYYQNNVINSLHLLQAMNQAGVKQIVFSSTSAVYGDADEIPMHENLPVKPRNAYGHSKATVEWMITDYCHSYGMKAVCLRYFNAAGADFSGEIGEDPSLTGNIIPVLMQVLIGKREKFFLFGNQYDTPDGTQMRDYIHVNDLADGHLAAMKALADMPAGQAEMVNLGTGQATSNQQLMQLVEQVSGRKLKYEVTDPRPGDPVITVSAVDKARKLLGWQAQYNIEQIIKSQWQWVQKYPDGYHTSDH